MKAWARLPGKRLDTGATSAAWAVFMLQALYSSRRQIRLNLREHDDIDQLMNRLVFAGFAALIVLQVLNVMLWRGFAPLLPALSLNLAGAATQFTRLIRSTFHD